MNYQINADQILFTRLGDEGVVYEIDKNEYTTLNETMLHVLSKVEQGKNVEEITSYLCSIYDISATDCLVAVNEALSELLVKEYITVNME